MARSRDTFDDSVRREIYSVRRYALSITKDPWLADDVVQETFLRAWRFWESYRGDSTRQAWLIRICRHVAFDAVRRSMDVVEVREHDITRIDSPVLSQETLANLAELSLEHREVLVLIDLLGYDYATVAVVLDCPVGTVRSRLNRARSSYRSSASNYNEVGA